MGDADREAWRRLLTRAIADHPRTATRVLALRMVKEIPYSIGAAYLVEGLIRDIDHARQHPTEP